MIHMLFLRKGYESRGIYVLTGTIMALLVGFSIDLLFSDFSFLLGSKTGIEFLITIFYGSCAGYVFWLLEIKES